MQRAQIISLGVRGGCGLLALILSACGAVDPNQSSATTQPIPAAIVNDACGAMLTADSCQTSAGSPCNWLDIGATCPHGAVCPPGVCVSPDPCAQLVNASACQADDRCAWSSPVLAQTSPALCPVGSGCGAGGGYCHVRDASGGGCTCVRPLACPANGDCPDVACDCPSPPPGGGGGGGGTCTCACPDCAPGASCEPCKCDCGGGGGGGGGGSCGGGGNPGTCTCACPTCAPGENCPPCKCACGDGVVGVSGSGSTGSGTTTSVDPTMVGRAATAPQPVVDPCAKLTDAASCQADTSNRCVWYAIGAPCIDGIACPGGVCQQQQLPPPPDPCASHTDSTSCSVDTVAGCTWIEIDIACFTVPCPTGACVQKSPVPGGGVGGGCGCACPACAAGQSCAPCTCDCCVVPPDPVPVPPPQPEPTPASGTAPPR